MKRRVYIALAFAAVSAAVVLALRRSEPAYEGKSLSDWIIQMRQGRELAKARAVVHQLGTNAIPLLLEWLQRPDRPSLKGRYWEAKYAVIGWLEGHRLMTPRAHRMEMDRKGSYRALAMWAFREMGPDAKEAIPTLIQWLGRKARDTNELDEVAGAAYCVLGHLGPPAVPPLIEALSSRDDIVYALAAGALGDIGPDAKAAIPVLEKRLKDKNPMMRVASADIIGKIGGDPKEFMPVMIQALRESDLEDLGYVLDVLVRYKKHAQDAVPVLEERLRTLPDSGNLTQRMARDELKGALQQLAPEGQAEDH